MNAVTGRGGDGVASTGGNPRALLVLGAPRSGTTLIGNYLGSSPEVLNLGEYGGFHLAHNIARSTLGALPGPFRDDYLADVADHARRFAEQLASERGLRWYCDATPWNLSAAASLARQLDDAVFVLLLRHYSGTIQSLRRSYAGGFSWAGATWSDSAAVWAHSYSGVGDLPPERTIVMSYDALATEPRQTLSILRTRLEGEGVDCSELQLEQFTVSHAPPLQGGPRPTIGHLLGDEIELHSIPSYDPAAWSGDIQRMVWPSVREVHHDLKARFPAVYRSPPPPPPLYAHDEIAGLAPFELGDAW